MEKNTCCFFGHRKIDETKQLKKELYTITENLIVNNKVDTFLFGSNSRFNDLCYETVTKLKETHPHIKRIYVRAEYPYIDEAYERFILKGYEKTYFPEKIINAGRAVYVERNYEMIDKSEFCVVYYKESYLPPKRKISNKDITDYQPKSGTKIAYEYAKAKNRQIFELWMKSGRVYWIYLKFS